MNEDSEIDKEMWDRYWKRVEQKKQQQREIPIRKKFLINPRAIMIKQVIRTEFIKDDIVDYDDEHPNAKKNRKVSSSQKPFESIPPSQEKPTKVLTTKKVSKPAPPPIKFESQLGSSEELISSGSFHSMSNSLHIQSGESSSGSMSDTPNYFSTEKKKRLKPLYSSDDDAEAPLKTTRNKTSRKENIKN